MKNKILVIEDDRAISELLDVYKRQDMKQAESQEDDVSIEGMRILLAEDNELNMEIAKFLLTRCV